MEELRSVTAGEDEKRRMIEILQRLHQAELEGSGSESGEEGAEGEGSDEEGGISVETLRRLLAKVGAPRGRAGMVCENAAQCGAAAGGLCGQLGVT